MTDQRLESIVAGLLRTGVLLSAAVVLAGGVWYLAGSAHATPHFRPFAPEVRGVGALTHLPGPQALMLAGLLLLIATPIARVMFALVAFALERDRTYVICTLIVLVVLLYSLGTAWW